MTLLIFNELKMTIRFILFGNIMIGVVERIYIVIFKQMGYHIYSFILLNSRSYFKNACHFLLISDDYVYFLFISLL